MTDQSIFDGLDEGLLKTAAEAIQKLIGAGNLDDILAMVAKIVGAKGSIEGIVKAIQGLFGNAIPETDIADVATGMVDKGGIDLNNVLGLFEGIGSKIGGFEKVAQMAGLAKLAAPAIDAVTGAVSGAKDAAADTADAAAEGVRRVTRRASEVTGEVVAPVTDTTKDVMDAKPEPAPNKGKKKWPVALGVILAVLVAAGAGMWVWHEQPSFCNAFCHTPMDTYLVNTYEGESGQPGTDKWGNEVSDAHAMLVVSHKDAGVACLQCHEPSLQQQIGEVIEEVSGNYYYPLAERSLEELLVNAGKSTENMGDEFCLKSGCHEYARKDMIQLTNDQTRNPHMWLATPHMTINMEFACSDCHKSHRASVNMCTQCHSDAEADLPSGWVNAVEGNKILKDYANSPV